MSEDTAPWLVFGHYGGHNTGDDAMLAGLIFGSDPAIRRRLRIVSKHGVLPAHMLQDGVTTIPASMRSVMRHFPTCHGIVFGGGTHFQDDFTGLRYIRHYRYMARFVALTLLARLLGKRVIWLGMGFGPMFRVSTRLLLWPALRLCHHITVRETASALEIRKWVAPHRLTHSFDLAALLQPFLRPSIRKTTSTTTTLLGVSVMSTPHAQTSGVDVDRVFQIRLREALTDTLAQHPALRVRIFIIRGGKREDDFAPSVQLYRALIEVDPARVEIIPYCDDPTITLNKMQECHAFLATRFHAAVLAYLAGCNLACIVYHRKLADLAHEIGLADCACIELSTHTSKEDLTTRLAELLASHPAYCPTLPIQEALARAQENIAILEQYNEKNEKSQR